MEKIAMLGTFPEDGLERMKTACELTPVEIATGIPLLPASSTSTVSYPTPQRW